MNVISENCFSSKLILHLIIPTATSVRARKVHFHCLCVVPRFVFKCLCTFKVRGPGGGGGGPFFVLRQYYV
jgi:hypothetical protein